MISLFPDEHILSQSPDNSLILTTHRLYKEDKSFSRTSTQSIMLEHITSCESLNKKYYFLLVLAALSLLFLSVRETEIIGIVGFFIFVILYSLTRKSLLKISSPSANIYVHLQRMSQADIYKIIEKIEHAKIQRINKLQKH